jgi:hypothetical protein
LKRRNTSELIMMKFFAINILLLAITFSAQANTYYVSATGDDNNSGLATTEAWASIAKVNAFTFAAGDIVSFEGGSSFSGSLYNPSFGNGTPGNRITITSYGTGSAIINSGLEEGILLTNIGNVAISNLIFNGSGYKLSGLYAAGVDFYLDSTATANCDDITIDNVECKNYGNWGILFSITSPNYGYNHVRVTNCLLHDNGYGGFQINGYPDPATQSIKFSNTDIYVGYTKAYNNLGRLDYTEEWTGSGILVSGTINGIIEYCEAYNNGKENGSTTAGPVGIFLGDSKFVTIQNCISHHNLGGPGKRDGGGFDLDQGAYGCVIQNCQSYENEGAGYGIYQAPTVNPWSNDTIRYNTSTNDGRNLGIYGAITFWGAGATYRVTNAEVYQNQVNMTKPGYALLFLNNNLTNANMYNNTFCLESPASYLNYSNPYLIPSNATVTNSIFPCTVQPAAIMPVPYRGAFAPSPAVMWTNSWTNYDPQNAAYAAPDSIIETNITTNTTLSGSKTYLIRGLVYVKDGAALNIEAGCTIRGEKSTANSSLIIAKGSKLYALGTLAKPIVFSSDQPAGLRNMGDWGGVMILGSAHYNGAGGQSNIEGIPAAPETQYGGGNSPNDNENSGVLQYIRIEYGGYEQAPNQKTNAFMLAAIGERTTIDHIQVSCSNEDGFKWFGGTVNCKYLVSYRNKDDNWDSDNGYNGTVQFGLSINDPNVASDPNISASEGSESTNDAVESEATPFTNPLFCNLTEIGPLRGNPAAVIASGYRRNVSFTNNSHLKIVNSVLMDFPTGVFIGGASCAALAQGNYLSPLANKSPGNLIFKNNLLAGNQAGKVLEKSTEWNMIKWFGDSQNDSVTSTNDILIAPYATSGANVFTGDYRPTQWSYAVYNYNWNDSAFYRFDSTGKKANQIACPVTVQAPATIIGAVNTCSYQQTGDTAIYYLSARSNFGILRYNWTVPAGVTIQSGQGTDEIVVKYGPTFTGGNISVRNLSYCGVQGNTRNLALQYSSPVKLGNDTTVYIICGGETVNLIPLYSPVGYATATWNTLAPDVAPAGNYQFIASNTLGCKDTATAFVKQDVAIWTGTVSKNWHVAGNWSSGRIPTEKTHVIINGITSNTCEIADMDAVAASVQAKSSGSISLTNGRNLIINGNCNPLPTGL